MRQADRLTVTILLHTLAVREQRMALMAMTPAQIEALRAANERAWSKEPKQGTRMADKPRRNSLALLARVLNSAGREEEDEAAALIQRRQRNRDRFLALAAKGHKNESMRETMLSEAEREHQLDDLEAALGANGGPSLDDEPSPETVKAREDLAAAKSSADASKTGEG